MIRYHYCDMIFSSKCDCKASLFFEHFQVQNECCINLKSETSKYPLASKEQLAEAKTKQRIESVGIWKSW